MSDTPAWSTTALLPQGAVPLTPAASDHLDALGPGTRLDEFEIVRVLGAGGFGIVYLALDQVLLRQVAIKEYMPAALAGRGRGAMVSARSAASAAIFAAGLESFFNEARLLAGLDHPSLVRVHRFWKANGTAYMAMQYYPGRTLKETREGMDAAPGEAWLRALIDPMLGALEVLHRQGVYHRDISPDNILLLPDGRPVLLDFGSARRVLADRTQSLTAILKPNFAPVEQYADDAGMRQGPWTDLYALGATLHYMLTGHAPTPAVLRAVRDVLPVLSAPGDVRYQGVPTAFLAAVDWTLAIAPADRPQDVVSARRAFSGEVTPPRPAARQPAMPLAPLEALRAPEPQAAPACTVFRPDAPPSAGGLASMRRRKGRGGRAALALFGLGVLGWAAWALNAPVAVAPGGMQAVSTATAGVVASDNAAPVPYGRSAASAAAPTLPSAPAALAAITASGTAVPAAPGADVAGPVVPAKAAKSRPARTIAAEGDGAASRSARPLATAVSHVSRPREQRAEAQAERAPAEPGSPKEACGDRNFFALAICLDRKCRTPKWQAHPQCVDAHRADERRQRRMERMERQ
ncbi:MAG: serine/threonine protein kinase [Steroidobacteraceae bacterium]